MYEAEENSFLNTKDGLRKGYVPASVVCEAEHEESGESEEYRGSHSDKLECKSLCDPDNDLMFWYSLTPKQLQFVDGSEIVYKAPQEQNFLLNSWMDVSIEEIEVLDEYKNDYKICLCNYFGFNVQTSSKININTGSGMCSMDKYSLLFLHSYCRSKEYEKNLDIDAGNTKKLTNWSTKIPSTLLPCPLYWFYSQDPSNAVPIHKITGINVFEHSYDFDREVGNHLRMKQKIEGIWTDVSLNTDVLNIKQKKKIKIPLMYGEFTRTTPLEKMQTDQNTNEYSIDNMMSYNGTDVFTYGARYSIPIITSGRVLKVIFVAAENLDAAKLNNHFNFTDNDSDMYKGESPIENIGIEYTGCSNAQKIPLSSFKHCGSASTSKHFNSSPRLPGIWAQSFVHDGSGIGRKGGIIPDDPRIAAHLVFTTRKARPGEKKTNFRVIMRLKISMDIEFGNGMVIV